MGLPTTQQRLFHTHNLNFFKSPIEIAVSVETFVQTEDLNQSFHSHGYSPTASSPQSEPKPSPLSPCTCMSLPRAHYDPRRVCLNPFPEFSIGKHRRTIGIYAAGALVGFRFLFCIRSLLSSGIVRPGELDILRRRYSFCPRSLSVGSR